MTASTRSLRRVEVPAPAVDTECTEAAKRTPGQVLREARARDSEVKRARVLAALDEMAAAGEKITFRGLARTARVSTWLVYAEGMREHIDAAIKNQGGAARHEAEVGSRASAESLAADLELAKAELRALRAKRDRLRTGVGQSPGTRREASEDLIARIQTLTAANQKISAERDMLMARLRETEAERDRLREALKDPSVSTRRSPSASPPPLRPSRRPGGRLSGVYDEKPGGPVGMGGSGTVVDG